MAGAEGFEPSDAGFKAPCLTAWRRPNRATSLPFRRLPLFAARGSRRLRAARGRLLAASRLLGDLLLVHREDLLLEVLAHLVVQRMCDVLERPVLPLLARHGNEQPLRSVDDLDVGHHERLVKHDRYERLELLVLHRDDLDVCDLHDVRSSPGPPNLEHGSRPPATWPISGD